MKSLWSKDELMFRNINQQTPLSEMIVNKNDFETHELLSLGAEKSIFVKGYSKDSLVCTLPQARQPKSSVFNHPPPFLDTRKEILDEIDNKLAAHIESLVREAVVDAVKVNAAKMSPAAAVVPVFNPFPGVLNVGDKVVR